MYDSLGDDSTKRKAKIKAKIRLADGGPVSSADNSGDNNSRVVTGQETEYDKSTFGNIRRSEEASVGRGEDSVGSHGDSEEMKGLRAAEAQKDNGSGNVIPDGEPTSQDTGGSTGKSGSNGGSANTPISDLGSGFYKNSQDNPKHSKAETAMSKTKKNSKKWKLLIAFGGTFGFLLVFAVLLIILFSFIGSLKVVHFATILRSAGFARFQFYMQEQYGKTIFDAAVLTNDSSGSGSKALGDRSLFQKLARVNPQARLIELGDEGTLKFEFQGTKTWGGLKTTNTFKGVQIEGQNIQIDDISQQLFAKNYADLGLVDRLRVQAKFINAVDQAGLSQRLAEEGLAFRSSVYNGLRQLAGIRMYKWVADQLNKYANGSPNEDIAENITETEDYVDSGTTTLGGAADELEKEAQDANQQATTQATDFAEATTGEPQLSPIQNLRIGLRGKLEAADNISTAAFIATVVCIANSLANSVQQAEQQNETEALRMAHDAQTTSDQIEQGNSDFNAQEVGAEAARWNNAEYSPFYKQYTGEPLTASDYQNAGEVPNLLGANSVVSGIANVIGSVSRIFMTGIIGVIFPSLGQAITTKVCNVLLNQFVQYGIVGVEIVLAFISGGTEEGVAFSIKAALISAFYATAQAGATVGVGALLGYFIDKAVSTIANVDYNGSATGPLLFSEDAVGTDELQQGGTRPVTYGAPITAQVAASQQSEAMNYQRMENSDQSFSQRYFAIDNPYSLLGNVAAAMPSSFGDLLSSARNGIASLANLFEPLNLFSTLGNILSPKAMAATNQTILTGAQYGVSEWGWTDQELGTIETDPNYTWQANANFVEPQYQTLYNEYMPCYQPAIQYQIPSQCTQSFLTTSTALHWRAYMAEAYDADHLSPDNTDQ